MSEKSGILQPMKMFNFVILTVYLGLQLFNGEEADPQLVLPAATENKVTRIQHY